MLGYLNAGSPFDDEGWYNTKDVVVEDNGYYQVVGREVRSLMLLEKSLWLLKWNWLL